MIVAWVPFLEPIPLHGGVWWLLIVPLVYGICVTYKAVRCESMSGFCKQSAGMAMHVLLVMAGLWLALQLLVRFVVPLL